MIADNDALYYYFMQPIQQSTKTALINSHTVFVREFGDSTNPTVVLIHGIGMSSEYFIPYAKVSARAFHVIALDLPGYGKASKPKMPLTIEALADVVVSFIQLEGISQATIIGQSMGCQIAAHVLEKAPKDCSAGVFLSPTINKYERTLLQQAFRLLQDSFREPLHSNFIALRNYARMGLRRYLITTGFMLRDAIEVTLEGVTQPILIIRGEKDPVVPRKWVTVLTSINQTITAREASGAPHLLQLHNPSEVASLTQEFIEGLK